MTHALKAPCVMCRSRTWCGRQCIHAPKPQKVAPFEPPSWHPDRTEPDPTKQPSDDRGQLPPSPGGITYQEEGIITGFTITETTRIPKTRIGIRIDDDVLAALKAQGPGWQTRLNQILRSAVLPS